jgi:hypothetical protein
MKKERVVGLCICVLLLGSLQAVWSVSAGIARFGIGGYSWTAAGAPQITARSQLVAAVVFSAWPPLGFLLGETGFLNPKAKDLPAHDTRKPPKRNPVNGKTSCPPQCPSQRAGLGK